MSADRLEHALDAIGWLKEFAGLLPDGYSFPAVTDKVRPNSLASYVNPSIIQGDLRTKAEQIKRPLHDVVSANAADYGSSPARLWNGGLLRLPSQAGIDRARSSSAPSPLKDYPDSSVARRALRRHEAVHSILQQRRGGIADSIAGYAKEEATAYGKQLFGPKSPAREMPLGLRVRKLLAGTYESTKKGVKTHGIKKWFERADYQAALDEARNRTDRNPTENQKKAGNYRKGSLSFQGIPVTLENPRGSIRRGVDDDGKPWGNEMHADYGYIPRTKGKDGDQVDVFLGPSHRSQLVVAIDQHKGGAFDETKFILGCDTRERAERLYLAHYPKDWKLGPVSTCTIEQFKEWLSLSHPGRMGHMKQPFRGQQLKALGHNPDGTKDFAGLIPDGYSTPYVAVHHDSNRLADHTSAGGLLKKHEKESQSGGQSVERQYRSQGKSDVGVSKLERGGRITIPSKGIRPPEGSRLGKIIRSYSGGNGTLRSHLGRGSRDVVPDPYQVARKALRRHEIVHSLLQQRRGGAPDTVAKLAGEELAAYRKQLFGRKSPAKHLPVSRRIAKLVKGTIASTVAGKKNLGISKWFEELTATLRGMKQFEKPFSGYNPKRHARTGGLNDAFRKKYNREHGSHLKRPVTTKPSELKPGSKAAKRRESFCARMSGVSGPTSKYGKLTPKGAALKRWNCSALVRGIKLFSQTPEEERHELLKTGLLSTGLAGGLALGGAALRGTVGAAEKVAIKRGVANKIASARRNARMAGEVRATETAKTAKVAAKERYRAGNASFQKLARNPNLTKGERETVKRVHGLWKSANPGKEFSSDHRERSGSQKLRDGAIGAGALAAGAGILHAGLKVGRAADEVTPTAKAIRAVLAHGEQAAGNFRKGWIGRIVRLSARPRDLKRFALRAEEDGIPYTGRVNRDRFVKQINESDLDRRDRNMDRAAAAGSVAGWLTHGKGSTLKQRIIRTGLGAGAGVGGVLAIRAVTDKKRDIYGDRPRWAKRAEILPTVAGVGTAGAILAKKAKLFAADDREDGTRQALKAGISGAASGALLGGGTALLTRGKSLKSALQAAGIGAGAMGALAGGGTAIGNKVLGDADPNDKAAFTKRAAVGGALAGAAIGGLGAVGLKKGLLGSKIADGFAKGAKTWRPLHAIEQSSAPVAAAVGAGAGALYGAHQGADEGMMVDAINNSRIASTDSDRSKKNLSGKIQVLLKEFGYSSQLREKDTQRYVSPTRAAMGLTDYDGALGTYQVAKGFYNKGKAAHRWGGRGTNLLRDTGDVLAGRGRRTDQAGRPQKREWEKAWFHRTVGSAAAGGALLGGALLTSKTRLGQQHILPQIKKADAAAQKYGVSLFSIKLNRLKQFDLDAALSGWDVRDPRGRSARVFAPGSRPRFRRPKEWHEKKENREALLKGAIVGTGVLGIAGGVAGGRKLAGLSAIPKMAKAAKSTGYPVINPGEKFGKFANFVPKEHRGSNIIDAPIKFLPKGAA